MTPVGVTLLTSGVLYRAAKAIIRTPLCERSEELLDHLQPCSPQHLSSFWLRLEHSNGFLWDLQPICPNDCSHQAFQDWPEQLNLAPDPLKAVRASGLDRLLLKLLPVADRYVHLHSQPTVQKHELLKTGRQSVCTV